MRKLTSAPNLALATLWADMLRDAGFEARVLRQYTGSIAGEIPPDQALPEIWIAEDERVAEARALLHQLRHPPFRRWRCAACGELVEGPFDSCWNCGALAPG